MSKLYQHVLRPCLFQLAPERAHYFALNALKLLPRHSKAIVSNPIDVLDCSFANPIGIAAGFDKDSDYIDAVGKLGAGFIECGTVTPQPQAGNPKPRLFRLPEKRALINRMGFCNQGLEHLVKRLQQKRHYDGVIGASFTHNKCNTGSSMQNDWLVCMQALYPLVDFLVINLSCPNTPNPQAYTSDADFPKQLLLLKQEQERLGAQYQKSVPLFFKIGPDLDEAVLLLIAEAIKNAGIDGIIACNTSMQRQGVSDHPKALEQGGLSGLPIQTLALQTITRLADYFQGDLPIIGLGGIMQPADVDRYLQAGAKLVQVYTGLIYYGPNLIRDYCRTYAKRC